MSQVGAEATLRSTSIAFGGDYAARLRTDCRLVGRGATGELDAVYFGEGDQTLDFRTFQDHSLLTPPATCCSRARASDRSRSVYTG